MGVGTGLIGHAASGQVPNAPAPTDASQVALKVMTANVRYGTADDGPDQWDHRKDRLVTVLRQAAPDLIGTQEMLAFQAQYLREQLVDYDYVGRSREMSNPDGEQCGVFFRTARFTPLEQGHFWLSETPEIPGSRGWDAALPRMATWLKLFDHAAQRVIIMLNTHFDHRGPEARRHSAGVMCAAVRRWSERYPIIITGDFNCAEGSAPYETLLGPQASLLRPLGDTYRLAHPERAQDEGTFHGFQGTRLGGRIDWVLVTPDLAVRSARIITEAPDGRYPSDHFPVIAELTYVSLGESGATPPNDP